MIGNDEVRIETTEATIAQINSIRPSKSPHIHAIIPPNPVVTIRNGFLPIRSLTAEDLLEAHKRALSTAATSHETGMFESQEPWPSDRDREGAAAAGPSVRYACCSSPQLGPEEHGSYSASQSFGLVAIMEHVTNVLSTVINYWVLTVGC